MLTQAARIVPNESVVCAELEGEMVLLNAETGIYFGLDQLGSEIWQQLSEGASETAVVATLLDQYDVSEAILRADVSSFIAQLMAKGLLIVVRS